MSLDNEIIDKTEQPEKKRRPKQSKKKPTKSKAGAGKLQNLKARFTQKRTKQYIGIGLILLSLLGFFACMSYFFTWKEDQDQVLNQGLFTYLFSGDDITANNWLGKFGAWVSHLLLYRWFGLVSILIPFFTFLIGVKIITSISLLPLVRTMKICFATLVWGSLFLGSFQKFPNYLGGSFGYYLNDWFVSAIGSFGMVLFLIASLYGLIVLLFNPDFAAIFNKLPFLDREEDEEETTPPSTEDGFGDFVAANPIKEEEIQAEAPSETIDLNDEEDEEPEAMIEPKESNSKEEAVDSSDDFEIELGADKEEPKSTDKTEEESEEMDVEIPEDDEELSKRELNSLQKEFGDYDPTLDLASYKLPSIDLLRDFGQGGISVNKQELEENKNRIVETLSNYKIDISKIKATVGPTVTLYEIIPAPGVRISKIKNLEDDIALSLSALGIRIIAPIPGKGTIGIEVPNSKPEMVSMRALIASEKFQNCDYELPVVMGKTITNETYLFDLTKLPHLLVAGATGQGKSVGLNAILVSILYKKHPAQVKFVLVDPKKVELTLYNKIERHFLAKLPGEEDAIITDTSKVVNTLNSLCIEMDERYELLKTAQARTIKEYNAKFISRRLNPEKGHRFLPYIVVLIDEFADLIMTAGKEVEHPIARIAQLARAVGIHLIVATQRPSVNVITGMIKANFPARIAFRVLSKIDSRTILDGSGADQLIGRGDMLISTGSEMIRLQCGFVDTPEVEAICEYIGDQRAYPDALLLPEYVGEDGESKDVDLNDVDALFADAARIVVIHQQGSASLLQRKLKLGYNRAGRIIDQLEGFGIIGPFQGSKARDVMYADETALEELLASKGLV